MGDKKWVFFKGTNPIRENEIFRSHGVEFKKGYIHPVSDEVFEWVKALRGFEVCKGVATKEVIDFPKPKEELAAKSYKRTYGPSHGEKKVKK